MKVYIITIYDPNPNYGNRLQNYAVQYVMEKMGITAETISFEESKTTIKNFAKYLLQVLSGYKLPGDTNYWRCEAPRQIIFEKFNRDYITTYKIRSLAETDKLQADYYIIGSDQVWNPNYYGESQLKKNIYFAAFAEAEKKVCFSPSFGIQELPQEWIPWFREQLLSFRYISVREEAGAGIVKRLLDKDAEILIDPTMMLTACDWMKLAKEPVHVDFSKPYILTCFLGGRSEKAEKDLAAYAGENGLAVYHLQDFSQPHIYAAGPCEFIYLVSQARLVMTDSFHACVFSFLFRKPFLVYDRAGKGDSMMSRLYTFLDKFSLRRKYADSGIPNDIFECHYEEGYKRLLTEREKVKQFLNKSMNFV